MKGQGYVIPSRQKDHHYFQFVNETDVPIKVVSGIYGNNINSLKFTVDVAPHSQFNTPASKNSWFFSAGGYVFVYHDGKTRPDAVADPGFPVRGRAPVRGGHGPPTWVLFGENVCKNERIGSHRGWRAPGTPPP